ncbi:L,D-transpeptidase [Ectobacillus ponti]|uniref:L,D-transpeptidase n=1 Tax=Ectobacillus ponti TaxID=2961894 RepID=A0AA41X9Z6_9BACI|nr:L,D-transpeptidase [Ectobacillus ponti]MCP8968146.1 L,D-transpeptidase [Ectobacillus ponti]
MKRILTACIVSLLLLFVPQAAAEEEPDHLILINLASNQLSYFADGQYIRTFSVSTGKPDTPTPEGNFCIVNKYRNKKYYRKNIAGGAPNNPLGTRWMGLSKPQYAIHGTSKEWSIGRYESGGCIRMHDRDVQWLYARAPLRTTVIITRFHEPVEHAAHRRGYRVTSWNGQRVLQNQIGRLTVFDRVPLYWRDPYGQLVQVQTVMPNEGFAVLSHDGKGQYDIGGNFYIFDPKQSKTRYIQVPIHIMANQYKRQSGVK